MAKCSKTTQYNFRAIYMQIKPPLLFLFIRKFQESFLPTSHSIHFTFLISYPKSEKLKIDAEVKECVELYLHFTNTPSWPGAQLKHRDNFTFTF
jgi:hypothetical protein